MGKHLQRAIQNLMGRLIALSARVEENVRLAVESVKNRDEKLARQAIDMDEEIDQTEIDIEEECLKILALHQPVAIDLRYIIAALKINNDLERIGDLAMDIAEHALKLIAGSRPIKKFDFDPLFANVQDMLQKSLDSLVHLDADKAFEVLRADDEVDEMNREMCQAVLAEITSDPENAEFLIQNMHVSKRLERVADHATNIAEDLIYLTRGEIVRHGRSLEIDEDNG
jgi:phosphate transport system protein